MEKNQDSYICTKEKIGNKISTHYFQLSSLKGTSIPFVFPRDKHCLTAQKLHTIPSRRKCTAANYPKQSNGRPETKRRSSPKKDAKGHWSNNKLVQAMKGLSSDPAVSNFLPKECSMVSIGV